MVQFVILYSYQSGVTNLPHVSPFLDSSRVCGRTPHGNASASELCLLRSPSIRTTAASLTVGFVCIYVAAGCASCWMSPCIHSVWKSAVVKPSWRAALLSGLNCGEEIVSSCLGLQQVLVSSHSWPNCVWQHCGRRLSIHIGLFKWERILGHQGLLPLWEIVSVDSSRGTDVHECISMWMWVP